MVQLSSIPENSTCVPFATTWTIRVWRAPQMDINQATPWVIKSPLEPSTTEGDPQNTTRGRGNIATLSVAGQVLFSYLFFDFKFFILIDF
jgi:hypothetical protein